MSDKKCKRCGACQECGNVPTTYNYPWYPYPVGYYPRPVTGPWKQPYPHPHTTWGGSGMQGTATSGTYINPT